MLPVSDALAFLAIQHQRVIALRQRVDSFIGHGRTVDLLVEVEAALKESTLTSSNLGHADWKNKLSDFYNRIEAMDARLEEMGAGLFITLDDVEVPPYWKSIYTEVAEKLTALNQEVDELFLK